MGEYLQQADLENAISPHTLVELFDDNTDGIADTGPLNAVIDRAEAQVNSYLIRAYPNLTLPIAQNPESNVVRQAALMFAIPFSFLRHPEYVRTFGENPRGQSMLDQAHAFMERLCDGRQYLFDVPAEPKPATAGGIVMDSGPRTVIDSLDGTKNGGDF